MYTVIGAAYEVSNTLGAGFLEQLYERALINELALREIAAKSQVAYPVNYKGAPWENTWLIWWSRIA